MVLQKFYFGKSCACGVGWVAKQHAAPGMGAAPAVAPLGQDPRTGAGGWWCLLQEPDLPLCAGQQPQNIGWDTWV